MKTNHGQAVVEFLLLLAVIMFITLSMVKAIGTYIGNSTGGIAFALTQELSVGTCAKNCFGSSFKNLGN